MPRKNQKLKTGDKVITNIQDGFLWAWKNI